MKELAGKVAWVTGASRGIGLATARALLEAGARLAMCALDKDHLSAAERELSPLGEVMAIHADVSDAQHMEHMAELTQAQFGRLDILINNAGVMWSGPFLAQEYASMARVVDVNVKGTLFATRAALPIMHTQGSGVIVNIASGAGVDGFADLASYCASKFAVVGFTQSLEAELQNSGIRVYALCPGRVATDMQLAYSGQRMGLAPERIAQKIVVLVSGTEQVPPGECLRFG